MNRKGQGAFEYVLLLAGVLLIVVLAIVLLRGGLGGAGDQQVMYNMCKNELAGASQCWLANGNPNPSGVPSPMPPSCLQYQTKYSATVTCANMQ
jgi:hypothetical protein